MSLDCPPPNLLGLAPPDFSCCWNHIYFAKHLVIFNHGGGGQSGTLTFFWNQLLTGQHSANSGEAYLKKNHPVDLQYMLLIHLQLRGNYYPVNVKESHQKYPFFWVNIAQIGSPPPKLIWTLFLKSDLRWLSSVFSSYWWHKLGAMLLRAKKGVQFSTHRGPLVLVCWQTHLDDD